MTEADQAYKEGFWDGTEEIIAALEHLYDTSPESIFPEDTWVLIKNRIVKVYEHGVA